MTLLFSNFCASLFILVIMSSSKLVLFKLKSELFKLELGDLSRIIVEAFMSLMLVLILMLSLNSGELSRILTLSASA